MADINNKVKTVCSFYASEWHLVTMLLPNIDKEINKGIRITTILENDVEENMEILLKKLNLKNTERILGIGWNKRELVNIEKLINDNEWIIISGTVEYINNVHKMIEENIVINKNITILDCYDVNECKPEIKRILNEHDKVLNTAGEKDKDEYITTIKIAN